MTWGEGGSGNKDLYLGGAEEKIWMNDDLCWGGILWEGVIRPSTGLSSTQTMCSTMLISSLIQSSILVFYRISCILVCVYSLWLLNNIFK